jgi:hypothetical protein
LSPPPIRCIIRDSRRQDNCAAERRYGNQPDSNCSDLVSGKMSSVDDKPAAREMPLRHWLRERRRDWWRRYRWPAVLLVILVWLHIALLAISHGWNALVALGVIASRAT